MMVLVTGGASCGKSAYAEALALAFGGAAVYLATMRPFGEEGARRIARHRAQRAGKGFRTIECYGALPDAVQTGSLDCATVLLEDLGNLVANYLFELASPSGRHDVLGDIALLLHHAENLVVVGNEIGCDGMRYDEQTNTYREELGRVACGVAAESDIVVECVSGIPFVLKAPDSLPDAALVLGKGLGL